LTLSALFSLSLSPPSSRAFIDIQQLNLIMELLGKPSEEFMDKISSDSVISFTQNTINVLDPPLRLCLLYFVLVLFVIFPSEVSVFYLV